MAFTCSDICKIIFGKFTLPTIARVANKYLVAVVLPPLGVFLERGCVCDLLINIALTCLGYIPGISKYLPI